MLRTDYSVGPGYVARRHELEIDLEEMRRAHLEREIRDHLQTLRSVIRIKAWLNPILAPYGLHVIRRPAWGTT